MRPAANDNFRSIFGMGSNLNINVTPRNKKDRINRHRQVKTVVKDTATGAECGEFDSQTGQCGHSHQFLASAEMFRWQLRWPSSESVRLGSCRLGFYSESGQTNDFKIGIHSFPT